MDWAMINLIQVRTLLREMVIGRGFRVEVYERSDDSEWEGTFGSPGNLSCIEEYVFDPNGFDSSIPSCRVLVLNFVSKTSYGLAVVDGETREAQFATLEDDERFSQLEAVIVQAQVKEVIICTKPSAKFLAAVTKCSA